MTSSSVGSGFGVTANSTVNNVAQSGTTGSGSGARFTVVSNSGGNGLTSVTVTAQGTGYKVGDTITIAGTSLTGGASPADDVTLTVNSAGGIIQVVGGQFTITQPVGAASLGSLDVLGLQTSAGAADTVTTTDWVDEKAPAIKVNYNENTQQLEFTVDRTVLGTGTESNFNSFSIFGSATADSTNNLGCLLYTSPSPRDATLSRMPSSA